jgi:hypothetical protein
MIQYEDFSIRIESKRGDLYPVRVLRSPAGEGSAGFEPAFDLDELGDLLAVLGQTVRGTGLRDAARVVTPGTQPRELGHQLYNALFSGSVRSLLDSSRGMLFGKDRGLRIKLHIDPDDPGLAPLASLPWELLYRKRTRDFLSLSHSTPVVRYLDIERPYTPLALDPPLHILVVVSSPAGYQKLDLDRERALIEQSWAQHAAVEVDFTEKATIRALQDRLATRDYHVLHFMGHGDFDERSGQGVLLLEDSEGCGHQVDGHALGVLLHDARTLRLVVLNACETARVTAQQGLDPFAGIATALVLAGIPAVVAMQFPITDGAAITFAERFYPLLAKGRPVDYAMTEARKAIYVAEPGTLEWATPVLFMRSPKGVLFEVSEAQPPQVPPAGPPAPLFESHLQPERIVDGEPGRVTVQNLGDGAETFQLSWQDPAQDLVFDPARTELSVAQGQSATVPFRAALGRRRWIGGEKTHPFTARVTSSTKETQTHPGRMVTKGLVPVWVLPVVMAAVALLSLFLYLLATQREPDQPSMTATAQAAVQTAEPTGTATARATVTATAQAATQTAEPTETVTPAGGPFSDPDIWGNPSHYETVHSGDINGDGKDELLGRGKEGMEAYRFNVTDGSWELLASGGPFKSGTSWDDEHKYFATIQSADIDGDGVDELLGRSSGGMVAYRFIDDGWQPIQILGDLWPDVADWDGRQYYATIHSGDIDGDGVDELLGRSVAGMDVWRFNGTSWNWIAEQGPWKDNGRWNIDSRYATIHTADIDGDGVDELLGRGPDGMQVRRFNGTDWDRISESGPFRDGTDWDDYPKYYATIQSADIDGDGVDELLGRGPDGMQVWRFNGTSWYPIAKGGPFTDAVGWDDLKYYATIQTGDIDGDGVDELLGLGPMGMEVYSYGWAPVMTGNW